MNLKGFFPKGLNFIHYIPVNLQSISVPYTVKNHKYGFAATWSHATDLYYPTVAKHGWDAEINALKYNLQMTVFAHWEMTNVYLNDILGFYNSGRCRLGSYEYAGEEYSLGQLNDSTYMAYIQNQYNWIKNNFGYYPSVASYGYGLETFKQDLKSYYMGVRNSGYNVNDVSYDIADTSSFEITTRQEDMTGDRTTILNQCTAALNNAIASGGWYRDFTHWHGSVGTQLADFFSSQRTAIGNNKVITLDFGTALEYMKFRQNLTGLNFYTDGSSIYISVNVNTPNLITKDMNAPISIAVDLTGTILAGKEIKSSHGVQKVSANNFVVEVPISGYAILSADTIGQYLDFSLPTVTNATTMNITTDKPTRINVFEVPKGQDLYNATLVSRDNNLVTSHNIDTSSIDRASYDVYVGCITKEKQSILQAV